MITKKNVGLILGGIVVAVVAILIAVFLFIINSAAYKLAVSTIQTNDTLKEIYGDITIGNIPRGSVSVQGAEGDAELRIPVKGTKTNGTIYVELDKNYGTRDIEELVSVDQANTRTYIIRNNSN